MRAFVSQSSLSAAMPTKSKPTTSTSATDDDELDEMLTQSRCQDILVDRAQDGRSSTSSGSKSSHNGAVSDLLEQTFKVAVDEGNI
jgi:hypothetical protein